MISLEGCTTTRCSMGQRGRAMLGVLLALGAWAQWVQGSEATGAVKAARPSREVDPAGCVTPECHADVKAYKVLHGPVAANTCDACHTLTIAKAHTFEVTRQKADLCT